MPEKALKLTIYNTLRSSMADKATGKATLPQEALSGLGTALVQVGALEEPCAPLGCGCSSPQM